MAPSKLPSVQDLRHAEVSRMCLSASYVMFWHMPRELQEGVHGQPDQLEPPPRDEIMYQANRPARCNHFRRSLTQPVTLTAPLKRTSRFAKPAVWLE